MSKVEKMMNLKVGNGIQNLIDEGHKILGNPINVFDTNYNLIAYTDVKADDRFWNELITTGTFCIESQIFFMNECFTDEVANAKKIAVMKSDKLKYDRILGHIFNGIGVKVANVLMIEYNESFDADTYAAFEVLVDLCTKEISNDKFYVAYGEKWQDAMINRLINGGIDKKSLYSSHVQILYVGFKANLYLAVVDISKNSTGDTDYFMDRIRQHHSDIKYAVHDGYIIMIISTEYKTFNKNRELAHIAEFIKQENLLVGISSCFDNLFELNKYYDEAIKALNNLKRSGKQHVSVYRKSMEKYS